MHTLLPDPITWSTAATPTNWTKNSSSPECGCINATVEAAKTAALIQSAICRLVYPPLILLGVICNLAALTAFQQRRLRRNPVSLGLSALAGLDTFVLLLSAGRYWSRHQLGFDWQMHSLAACRLSLFAEYWAADCSVWTLLLVTGQRWAATRLPLRAAKLCSRRRVVPLLAAAALACAFKNAPLLARARILDHPMSGPRCLIAHDRRLWLAFAWTDAVFRFLVPWPLLALLNASIWRGVRAAGRFRRRNDANKSRSVSAAAPTATAADLTLPLQQQPQPPASTSSPTQDGRRMLTLLVSVNLLFLVCQIPFCAFSLADSVFGIYRGVAQSLDAKLYVALATSFQLSLTLMYVGHAANFFFYFLSGRLFRRTLQRMLRRRRVCRCCYSE